MNLKKLENYLRVNLLEPGPGLMKKKNYRAAVSQRLRNTGLRYRAKKYKEYIDCRTVYLLLVSPEFENIIMHGMNNVEVINDQQARIIQRYKNTRKKLIKTDVT